MRGVRGKLLSLGGLRALERADVLPAAVWFMLGYGFAVLVLGA